MDIIGRTLKTAALEQRSALHVEPISHVNLAGANSHVINGKPFVDPFQGSSHSTVMAIQGLGKTGAPSAEQTNFLKDYYEALPQASEEAKMNTIKNNEATLKQTIDRVLTKVEIGELNDSSGKWTSYVADLKMELDNLKV